MYNVHVRLYVLLQNVCVPSSPQQFRVGSDASCSCDDIEFEDEITIGTLPWATNLSPSNHELKMAAPRPTFPPSTASVSVCGDELVASQSAQTTLETPTSSSYGSRPLERRESRFMFLVVACNKIG